MGDSATVGTKRKSRFESGSVHYEEEPLQKKINIDISLAAAKAAEISKELTSKIALVSSLLGGGAKPIAEKKPTYRPLLLDAQGREIDELGNLVKHEIAPVKTLAANVAATNAGKKKENPYLTHRLNTNTTENSSIDTTIIVDDRISFKNRESKAKRALNFVEAGKYLQEAAKIQEKEDRKIIAGYSSGRKALQQETLGENDEGLQLISIDEDSQVNRPSQRSVPPLADTITPMIEWWDELFLPKSRREQRKISKAASLETEDVQLLSLFHNKTYKYVQHPVPVKPLQVDKPLTTLPMYLTKQERKKLRKSIRQEREKNKRDQMMLGLLPTPEPKFKLNNFMKILGDQAVADPSKIELKVIQQVQKRILNHEMRNLANKLTPKERKEKKVRKLNEDLSRGCHVAVFRVTNFSCLKYRFKVDVNAQQLFLSGLVLLCPEDGLNLVVVEGGPKGIRKFVHLMTKRIKWNVEIINNPSNFELEYKVVQDGDSWNYLMNVPGMNEVLREQEEVDKDADDDDSNDDSNSESEQEESINDEQDEIVNEIKESEDVTRENIADFTNRRSDLLWQGVIPKRLFTGFKFQESKSSSLARKFLESKNLAHYWDMVENADAIESSTADIDSFF